MGVAVGVAEDRATDGNPLKVSKVQTTQIRAGIDRHSMHRLCGTKMNQYATGVVRFVLFDEVIVGIDRGFQPIVSRFQPGNIDLLPLGAWGVDVCPTDGNFLLSIAAKATPIGIGVR